MMTIKEKLTLLTKRSIASTLFKSKYIHHQIKKVKDQLFILMYHRILPIDKTESYIQGGMFVTPQTFDRHIQFLRAHFEIIHANQTLLYLQNKKKRKNERPLCLISFDDGWYDNYKFAYPILKKYQTPAIIFLPTNYIGTRSMFWTDRLVQVLHRIKLKEVSKGLDSLDRLVRDILILSKRKKNGIDLALEHLKPHRVEFINTIIDQLSQVEGNSYQNDDRTFLYWNEINEMFQSGLISFGSHTASHRILTTLNDTEIETELKQSKEVLLEKGIVESENLAFCYPNGNYNTRIMEFVKCLRYSFAVTTESGWNDTATNPYSLRRIAIHEDVSKSQSMFGCRLLNIF